MSSLPSAFIEKINKQFGAEAGALLSSLDAEPKTSVHINQEKGWDLFSGETSVPWFKNGRILSQRPSFTLDPLFHAGAYYPQESSSMFLHYILEKLLSGKEDPTCLDLCAAPGGKSILISAFLGKNGRLISNEINRQRNSVLRENLIKWGGSNTIVTCNEPRDFTAVHAYFDCIMVDAPCSGEGMFRKDLNARAEWSPDNVNLCSIRQKKILEDVAPSLKTGGYLIYSTCTFSREENEDICKWLIDSGEFEFVRIEVPAEWSIRTTDLNGTFGLQFLPHLVPGEGFFTAVFRKITGENSIFRGRPKAVFGRPSKPEIEQLKLWAHTEGMKDIVLTSQDDVCASPFSLDELNGLANHLYITLSGVELGRFMKKDFIPAHALSLSGLRSDRIAAVDVNAEDALKFLRGEGISTNAEPGWTIISYRDRPVGWIKALQNRSNNYYPKEWRIKMRG